MRFRDDLPQGDWQPYLPGASLKACCAATPKLARAWTLDGQGACNPLTRIGDDDPPCWHPFGDPGAGEERIQPGPAHLVYPLLCAICATFGSPYLACACKSVTATWPSGFDPRSLSRRDGVGIDRRRRAAADGAKYDFEFLDARPVRRADSPAQL
ncbi:MAG: hypothetical protein R2873_35215 [Caldilineaceae bacterium]